MDFQTTQKLRQIQELVSRGEKVLVEPILTGISSDNLTFVELMALGTLSAELVCFDKAKDFFEAALKLCPKDAAAYHNLGHVCYQQGQFQKAYELFIKEAFLLPDSPEPRYHAGLALEGLGQIDEAVALYQDLLLAQPCHVKTLVRLALLSEHGLKKESFQHYVERAWSLEPLNPEVLFVQTLKLRKEKNFVEACTLCESLLKINPDKADYYFEYGLILEGLKKFDQSYEAFLKGNQLKDQHLFDSRRYHEQAESLVQTLQLVSHQVSFNHISPTACYPVFIVGCVRSGTTLLAQMLDAHSRFYNEGELSIVQQVYEYGLSLKQKRMGLSSFIKDLWLYDSQDYIQKLQSYFKQLLLELEGSKRGLWVVDKMPDNALALGLIARLAPGAAIIHMIRDGREMAYSSFKQNFVREHWHSHDLSESIQYWMTTTRVVKETALLTKLPYHEVFYENLVSLPEVTLKGLLSFLGVSWEDACLRYYETDKVAKTGSYEQVSKKLYTSSLDFCRRHFPKQYDFMTQIGQSGLKEWHYL